jgi:hypothetical protein
MKTLEEIKEEIEINGFIFFNGLYICKGDFIKFTIKDWVFEELDRDSQYVIETTFPIYTRCIGAKEGCAIVGYDSFEECIESIKNKEIK